MNLTADTITDEQIRELYDSTDAYTESHDAAYAALGGRGHHRGSRSTAEALGEQLAARARCAEIINARNAGEDKVVKRYLWRMWEYIAPIGTGTSATFITSRQQHLMVDTEMVPLCAMPSGHTLPETPEPLPHVAIRVLNRFAAGEEPR